MIKEKNIYEEIYTVTYSVKQRHPMSAIRLDDTVVFCLNIPRQMAATEVTMFLFDDNGLFSSEFKMKWSEMRHGYDIYETVINVKEYGTGIFWHDYKAVCGKNRSDLSVFSPDDAARQILVYSDKFTTPAPVYGTMYHIFVDRFKRSGKTNAKDGAILNDDWENGIPEYAEHPGGYLKNNVFFGGDLYGITEKLDYIRALGVKYIYLSPIFDSPSNHKYDTSDYMKIDEMFGGEEALSELIKEAKKYSIKIILDGVFNHTGDDSLYFNKYGNYGNGGAYRSKRSKYHSWYTFRDYDKNRDDYECWWNIDILPRVNCDLKSYRQFILGKNGVVEKWFSYGISGFRLDVADELSDEFLKSLRKTVKKQDNSGIIIGEVWEDASNKISYGKRREYFHGEALDSVMNYPLRDAVLSYIKHGNYSLLARTAYSIYHHYPKESADCLMNILGTHDTARIITALVCNDDTDLSNREKAYKRLTKEEREKGIKLLSLSYMTLSFFPGIPCIFYGDEIGTEGYSDPFCRKTFKWDKTVTDTDDKATYRLLDFYRRIGKVRENEELLASGYVKILLCNFSFAVIMRYNGKGKAIIAVINRSDSSIKLCTDHILTDILEDEELIDPIIPPFSGKYLRLSSECYDPESFIFDVI